MPKQTGKSAVSGSLGAAIRKGFEQHKHNEVEYGSGGELPAGIEGGIAELRECKFDKYKNGDNAGEWYFYAAGVVVSPETFNGQKIAGLRTSIMEPMLDTPTRSRKTIADHAAWVINEFKKLGVDTAELDFEEEGVIESVAAALKEQKPNFRFRTWKGKAATEGPYAGQEPRVQHEWRGLADFVPSANGDDGVQDNTAEAPEEKKPAAKPAGKPAKKEPEPEPAADEEDLDALAEAADGGDEEAQNKLVALAESAGVDEATRDGAENWAEVAGLIRIGEEGEEEDKAEAEEEGWKPAKEDLYGIKPIDPKTKKAGKLVECEVVSVNEENQTVTVKIGGKLYSDPKTKKPIAVEWDKLETSPE